MQFATHEDIGNVIFVMQPMGFIKPMTFLPP